MYTVCVKKKVNVRHHKIFKDTYATIHAASNAIPAHIKRLGSK